MSNTCSGLLKTAIHVDMKSCHLDQSVAQWRDLQPGSQVSQRKRVSYYLPDTGLFIFTLKLLLRESWQLNQRFPERPHGVSRKSDLRVPQNFRSILFYTNGEQLPNLGNQIGPSPATSADS